MIVSFGEKHFNIVKFPPIVGRELMVKGDGAAGLLERKDYLPVLAHVKVRIAEDRWMPLSTKAMVDNHVPPGREEELFMLVLAHNCYDIRNLLAAPTPGQLLKELAHEIIEDAIDGATGHAA